MKTLLFSVTKDDFEWQFFRAGGKGGQNQNKRDTACRCIHRESGAIGEARDERSQLQNRRLAFSRCVKTPKFQLWLKIKTAGQRIIENKIDLWMRPENIKIEYGSFV